MPSTESLEQKSRIVDLLEIYGGLLTERQREFIRQHYAEDLSYGEISEALGISRQAVHDAIGHGKRALDRFEAHLHMAQREPRLTEDGGGQPGNTTQGLDIDAARQLIACARSLVGEDLMYDTSKLKKILAELEGVLHGS